MALKLILQKCTIITFTQHRPVFRTKPPMNIPKLTQKPTIWLNHQLPSQKMNKKRGKMRGAPMLKSINYSLSAGFPRATNVPRTGLRSNTRFQLLLKQSDMSQYYIYL